MPGRGTVPTRLAMSWPTPEDFLNDSLWIESDDEGWVPSEDRDFMPMTPLPNSEELYIFEPMPVEMQEQVRMQVQEEEDEKKDNEEHEEVFSLQRMRSPSLPPTPRFARSPSPTASEFDNEVIDDVFFDEVDIEMVDENNVFYHNFGTLDFAPYLYDVDYDYFFDDRYRA